MSELGVSTNWMHVKQESARMALTVKTLRTDTNAHVPQVCIQEPLNLRHIFDVVFLQ